MFQLESLEPPTAFPYLGDMFPFDGSRNNNKIAFKTGITVDVDDEYDDDECASVVIRVSDGRTIRVSLTKVGDKYTKST